MKAKNFYMDCTRNKEREEKREIEDRLREGMYALIIIKTNIHPSGTLRIRGYSFAC